MTPAQSKRVVLGGLVLTGLMASGNQALKGELPPLRIVWGVAGAGVALGLVAELAPAVAAALVIVLAVSTALLAGSGFWTQLDSILSRKDTKP